jgi:membrane-associated phospholipid phosphatase
MKRQIDGLNNDKVLSVSSSSHTSIPFTRHRLSQVVELLLCTAALVFSWVFYDWGLRERPIPYQYLPSSGEYVKDLAHDESLNYFLCINNFLLHLFAVFWPILFQVGWILTTGTEKWFDELHAILCCNFSAMAMVWFVSYAIKCHVGYLRPVYYKYCEPSEKYQECTLNKSFIHYSFPSAHTSDAFCGMTILAMFLDRTWRQYNTNRRICRASGGDTRIAEFSLQKAGFIEHLVSLMCVMGPFSVASFIGCTRIYNNFHYPADVLAGAILGSSASFFCFGLWFDHGRDVCVVYVSKELNQTMSHSRAVVLPPSAQEHFSCPNVTDFE